MSLNIKEIDKFYEKYKNTNCLIFGFTSILWKYFYQSLLKTKKKYNFKNGIILHGGGWKKMHDEKVNNNDFKKSLKKNIGVKDVFNYYGMVEQTGSIFLECEYGYYHASIFSEINTRNNNLEICKLNQKGIIQVSSLLPTSYPGHNILTEDLGEIKGIDNCKCGRKGKYFKIYGRLSQTEIKGCGNV